MAVAQTKRSKKSRRIVTRGNVYVNCTFNNTVVTLTDEKGNVLAWSTSGANGFKGSRKRTPYAAGIAGEQVALKAKEHGVREVNVFVSGPGGGRDAAIRPFAAHGIRPGLIKDISSRPHNGARPPKRRRV